MVENQRSSVNKYRTEYPSYLGKLNSVHMAMANKELHLQQALLKKMKHVLNLPSFFVIFFIESFTQILLTVWNTSNERISGIFVRASTYWIMLHHITFGFHATRTNARINAFLITAGSI